MQSVTAVELPAALHHEALARRLGNLEPVDLVSLSLLTREHLVDVLDQAAEEPPG